MDSGDVNPLVLTQHGRSASLIPDAPRLSHAACAPLREILIVDERGEERAAFVPNERPLTILIDNCELVTLMTLGGAPEWLVAGYLLNQRLITDVGALESIMVDWSTASVRVQSRGGITLLNKPRQPVSATGCSLGTVFGDLMVQMQGMALPPLDAARISRSTLLSVLETVRSHDDVHRAAGSVHGCALFQGDGLWMGIEDVSRHNGVDTVAGWMALHGVTGADKILFTTGRLTGEMVMKAAYNGIPIMVTRNGVTAMGHEVATRLGMTLFGRAANRRYLCYAGAQRFDSTL